ncbi:MAG: glucose-6-phosphate isomerase [Clostridia bacterium]
MKMMKLESESFAEYKNAMDFYAEPVAEYHKRLHDGSLPMTGWVDLPSRSDGTYLAKILSAGEEIRRKYTALVVVGIGGSYLGTRACYEMLRSDRNGVSLFFAGWNLGSSYHARLLRKLENYDVALCVVSKSGTTMETALAFDLLKTYLKNRYGERYVDRIYVVTDETRGALREEAKEKGYHSFALDENIGGRYSVLTAVGLLPLAVAGIDVVSMLNGAKRAYEDFCLPDLAQNDCYRYAAFRNVMFKEGKAIEFFSFSEPEFSRFGYWLRQLFAESEGKNGVGIYPASLSYSTDLHSVGQFLEEGHPVFFETMLTVDLRKDDLAVEGHDKTYNEYIAAAAEAVYRVRNERKTPVIRLRMSALNAENIGYVIYFFEKACAMSCMLMGVNPFDQPGVEAYKKEMRALLGIE